MKQFVELDPETQAKLTEWSKKLGLEIDEMMAEFSEIYDERKAVNPGMPETALVNRVKTILGARYSSDLRSKAPVLVGLFFGTSEEVDVSEISIRLAKEEWSKANAIKDELERQAAVYELIRTGVVDSNGTPLDTREFFPNTDKKNPNYGKSIKPFHQKLAIGVGKVKDTVGFSTLILRMRQDQAKASVPEGFPVQFRANLSETDELRMILNSSVATRFKQVSVPEFAGKSVLQLLAGVPKELRCSPIDLEQWHDDNKGKIQRVVFVTGDVVSEAGEPTTQGNYRIMLGDVEENIEFLGATCFVPAKYADLVRKLGTGSKVAMIGTTSLGMDMNTGEKTQVNLNVYVPVPIDIVEPVEDIFIEEPNVEVP